MCACSPVSSGANGLTETDRLFLDFGDRFEREFINQQGERSLRAGMEIGWKLLGALPTSQLIRLNDRQIKEYIERDAEEKQAYDHNLAGTDTGRYSRVDE